MQYEQKVRNVHDIIDEPWCLMHAKFFFALCQHLMMRFCELVALEITENHMILFNQTEVGNECASYIPFEFNIHLSRFCALQKFAENLKAPETLNY